MMSLNGEASENLLDFGNLLALLDIAGVWLSCCAAVMVFNRRDLRGSNGVSLSFLRQIGTEEICWSSQTGCYSFIFFICFLVQGGWDHGGGVKY